ncbi:hypothetical protein [Lelliottia wanjuensis]|uniref:Scaffolding protein n=1 Tax=Lelliottia wanjuensis TaxID=3050585 RepID=A0AAP4FWN2_9ENTR|nr:MULTISPECIES: hypothetical protein [unclassified Lelliottia]MDK9364177.1 hypothetical protein [Lelliottia sp. V106_12]MDK9617146.1 hypothetical protein [Lelliottia sp. V106_9]
MEGNNPAGTAAGGEGAASGTGAAPDVATGAESAVVVATGATQPAGGAPAGEGAGGEGTGGEGTTATPPAADALMFGDTVLPDFVPPNETPREKELRLELEGLKRAAGTGQQRPQQLTAEPQKPDRLAFNTDEEYESAFEQFVENRGRWREQVTKQQQRVESQQRQFVEAVQHYSDGEGRKTAIANLKDFAAVEQYVDDNLDPNVMAAILFGGKDGTFSNPHNMLYAIGRQPELLKQLNDSANPILAGAKLLEISQKSNFAPKAPVNPGNSVPSVSGGGVSDLRAQLETAEKEAAESGDRTKVIDLRAQINAAETKK